MFEWDAANTAHIARHGIAPDEAEQVIQNDPLDLELQFRNGEQRMMHLGETDAGRVLFVVVTTRNRLLRVVTAHPAGKKARAFYSSQKESHHG